MQSIAFELEAVIDQYLSALNAISENEMSHKPSPSRWSKKEILGHLIDSAQNNIRRFIVAQYEEAPLIVYNQDKWVNITQYQDYKTTDLISLWYLLNKHIAVLLKNMSPEATERKCRTENLRTLDWLAQDYFKHLRHHLHQILDLEPVAYP
ncbi:MAG: DinB family protein [Bacteroidota bacterium]|nr:DinB family protein [Bacteroidota bacterium]